MGYSYYGDKISKNMLVTEEGYLVCCNVPIGRVGWMDYLGQELPEVYKLLAGSVFKVGRTAEELFRPETIASFEGKPVTNCHPAENLTLMTAAMTKRGHMQNVRKEGDFLLADLFIDDPALLQEVQNDVKREVSCGYDCSWHDLGNGKFEQRDIIGNHVAIVQSGRAGPRVAIKDEKPKELGGKKLMANKPITKKFLAALGLKHFAQDAEPEDLEKAMDAINEEDEMKAKDCSGGAPVAPQKDELPAKVIEKIVEEAPAAPAKDDDSMVQVLAILEKIVDRLDRIEQAEMAESDPAEDVLDAAEVDFSKELPDEEGEEKEVDDAEPMEEPAEEKKAEVFGPATGEEAQDAAAFKKFVADMKPIIMAIPDEKLRLEGAKTMVKFAKDARKASSANGYANILSIVNGNRKAAADDSERKAQTDSDRAITSCNNWKKFGDAMQNKVK